MTSTDIAAPALTVAEQDALIDYGRRLKLEIDERQEKYDDVKRRLRAGVEIGTTREVDGQKFALVANRRFDLETAVSLLPDDAAREACQVVTRTVDYDSVKLVLGDRVDDFTSVQVAYDAKKVKALLPPALVDGVCMKDAGEVKVVGL